MSNFASRYPCRGVATACGAAWLLAVIFCLPAAKNACCAESPRVERSQRSRPGWVTRVPEADSHWMYFVGRSSGASSLEAAEQDAAADAVGQAVAATGLRASLSYNRLRSEAGLLLHDRLTLSGQTFLEGLKREALWYEKTTYHSADSLRTSYEAHLLVRLPLDALEKARMKLEQEASVRVSRAEELLAQGRRLEEAGGHQEALDRFRAALELTGAPGPAYNPDPTHRDELARELAGAVFRSGLELRTLLLAPKPGAFPDPLRQALYSALLLEGLTPVTDSVSLGARALPRLGGECVRSAVNSLEDGFRVCLLSLSLQLVAPLTGELVLASDYTAKGFGPDEERATLDALRKIRLELIPRFARELHERLDQQLGPAVTAEDKLFFAR